ncbi:DedA family protein [Thermovibrio sp.]
MELSSFYSLVSETVKFIELHPKLACLVIFGWAFLETALLLGLILPAEKVLVLSSVLAAKGVISPLHFVVCGTLGTFLGYTVSYFMGAYLGEGVLGRLIKRFGVSEDDLLKTKEFVEKKGELSVLFGRFIPVVRPLLPVVIGSFKPSFLNFTLFNLLGAVIWMLSYLFFGNLIGEFFLTIIRHKEVALPLFLLILIAYLIWRRYGKNRGNL